MMNWKQWISIGILVFPLWLGAQTATQDTIKWMDWETAVSKQKTEKRKVLMYVYVDYCALCKQLDEKTFTDSTVVAYINRNFYPVRFRADTKQEISFKDKTYRYAKSGKIGYHQFVAESLDGRLSFPSLVFFNEDLSSIQSITGYKPADEMELITIYFGEDYYKTTPWAAFQRNYRTSTERK